MAKTGRLKEIPFHRKRAVAYAEEWAYRRNPAFYDFSDIGGDCTNFASQCLLAGSGVMNFRPTYGWYYSSLNDRAPAWTGVEYLYRFLTSNDGPGPFGTVTDITGVRPGDIVQLRFIGSEAFGHSPVITAVGEPLSTSGILVAAHSTDCSARPLSTYQNVAELRFLHISGTRVRQ